MAGNSILLAALSVLSACQQSKRPGLRAGVCVRVRVHVRVCVCVAEGGRERSGVSTHLLVVRGLCRARCAQGHRRPLPWGQAEVWNVPGIRSSSGDAVGLRAQRFCIICGYNPQPSSREL